MGQIPNLRQRMSCRGNTTPCARQQLGETITKGDGVMRRWIKMWAGIGLIAACAMGAGCGGGNAPRASAGSQPARNLAPRPPTLSPAPVATKPVPEPVPADAKPPQPPPAVAAKEGENDSGEEKPAAGGQSKPAPKPDADSSTAEMLAIATNNPPASTSGAAPGPSSPAPANPEPPGDASPAGSLGTPSQAQGGPAGYPGMGNSGGMPAGYPGAASPDAMPAGYPGVGEQARGAGVPGSTTPGGMPAGYPGIGRQPGGYPGFPGPGGMATGYPGMVRRSDLTQGVAGGGASEAALASRGGNGPNPNLGPVDKHSPQGAVQSFLFALSVRDRERLREATARRSQFEASSEQQKELFRKIVNPEENISDAELEEIARKLEGYVIAGENAVHTTGKLGVIIMRPTREGGYLSRTVTVRKEKKGWGVMDVSSPTEFTATGGMRHKHPGAGER